MSEETTNERAGMSRRTFAGLGAAAGAAAAVATLPGMPAAFAGGRSATVVGAQASPSALGAVNPALTYLPLDAFAFETDATFDGAGNGRVYQELTGVQPITPARYMNASLPVPAGSIIHQLNVAYQGSPIMEIRKRSMLTPVPYAPAFQQTTVVGGGGPQTMTFDLATPVVVEQGETVAVRFFASAGDSVLGVTVGYLPPAQSFLPFTGGTPRVLDTRETGGKLADGEERVIALGFVGARGAVINLTITETEGNGGFVAVFPSNIPYPGNSSINWTSADQNIANGVITAMDPAGRITIRGGAASTHVIIDRIGWFV
jgi:hypothetical protein